MWKRKVVRSRHLPFAGDYIDCKVLHCRVHYLFNISRKAVHLIYKQHVPLVKVRKYCSQVTRLFHGWAGRNAQVNSKFICNNPRKRCFADARRAVKQDMVKAFFSLLCRLDKDGKVFLHFFLPYIFGKPAWPQRIFNLGIFRRIFRCNDAVFKIAAVFSLIFRVDCILIQYYIAPPFF